MLLVLCVEGYIQLILISIQALGEDLSQFADNSFDAVLETHVLCSVSDVSKTLSEVRRVLKPGGKFLFLDHVLAPKNTWLHGFHKFMTQSGFWPFMTDGCQLDRDVARFIKDGGFDQVEVTNFFLEGPIHLKLVKNHIYGVATK